MNREVSVIE